MKSQLPESIRQFVNQQETIPILPPDTVYPYSDYVWKATACILLSGRIKPKSADGQAETRPIFIPWSARTFPKPFKLVRNRKGIIWPNPENLKPWIDMTPSRQIPSREQVSITGEANYIISRAQVNDSYVVKLGNLICCNGSCSMGTF